MKKIEELTVFDSKVKELQILEKDFTELEKEFTLLKDP